MSIPLARIADTFSKMMYFGRTMRMVLMSWKKRPDLEVSVMPFCCPALLISWHGKPAEITEAEYGSALKVEMSS
tara:strand:- start:76 stop:297 length:222 start_codon:yes stop_codon:yes gene_type:complete